MVIKDYLIEVFAILVTFILCVFFILCYPFVWVYFKFQGGELWKLN